MKFRLGKIPFFLICVFVLVASTIILFKSPIVRKIYNKPPAGHFIMSSGFNSEFTIQIDENNFLLNKDYFILSTDQQLANQIQEFLQTGLQRDINNTPLCKIFAKYGSDKSTWHNYSQVYNYLLKDSVELITHVFEVGIGTNNTDVPSNMGKNGKPGASLRGWREFLPNSTVYAADIDKRILFNEDRIHTYYADQLNPNTIRDLWQKIGNEVKFDIILDDGLHTFEANTIFMQNSYDKLKSGGLYIVEDIDMSDDNNIWKFYQFIRKNNYSGVIFKLPYTANNSDNCLLIVRKP